MKRMFFIAVLAALLLGCNSQTLSTKPSPQVGGPALPPLGAYLYCQENPNDEKCR